MTQQYLRKVSLIAYGNPSVPSGTGLGVPAAPASTPNPDFVSGLTKVTIQGGAVQTPPNQPGIELGALRIQFKTSAIDVDSPPHAVIRVINPSKTTAERFSKEFQSVTLQAGYENGNFGVIFQGSIVRIRRGRLSNIENFVDIMASNLDAIYNFGFVNGSLAKGQNGPQQQINMIRDKVNSSPVAQGQAGAQAQGMQLGYIPSSVGTGGTLPRGKVLFGLARDKLNDVANSTGMAWQIGPDGKINFHPLTGYLPGEAVVLNSQTGMIGIPEATNQGIEVNCLLNPLIKAGTLIKINNADLVQSQNVNNTVGFPAYADFQFFANQSNDGTYMAMVVEHEGDSRGHGGDWVTKIVALAVDASGGNQGSGSVAAY